MKQQQILPFRIIEASSEDSNLPSSELKLESGKGWRSARHATSPRHLIIQPLLGEKGSVVGLGEDATEVEVGKKTGEVFVPTLSQIQIRLREKNNTRGISQKIELFVATVTDDTIAVTADCSTGVATATNGANDDYDDAGITTAAKHGTLYTKGTIDKAKVQSISFDSLGYISYASNDREHHQDLLLSRHQSQEQGQVQEQGKSEGEGPVKIISLDHVPASLLKIKVHDFDTDTHHSCGSDVNVEINKPNSNANTRVDYEYNSDSDSLMHAQAQSQLQEHTIGIMAITLYGSMKRIDNIKDDTSITGVGASAGNDSGTEMSIYTPLEEHLEKNNSARSNWSAWGASNEVNTGREKDRSLEQILLIKQKALKEYFDQLNWHALFGHMHVVDQQQGQQDQLKQSQGIDGMQMRSIFSNLVSLLQTIEEQNIVLNSAVTRENYLAASTIKSQRDATRMILTNSLDKLNRVLARRDDTDEENGNIDKVGENDESACSKRRQVNFIRKLNGIGTGSASIETNENRDQRLKQSLDDLSLSTIRRVDNDNEVIDPVIALDAPSCIESLQKEKERSDKTKHPCTDSHNATACIPLSNSLDNQPILPTKQKSFEDLPILNRTTAVASSLKDRDISIDHEIKMDGIDQGKQSIIFDIDGSHPLEGVPHYMDLPIPENSDIFLDDALPDSSRNMKYHHRFSNGNGFTPGDIKYMDKILGPYRSRCIKSKNWALREAAVLKLSLHLEDIISNARSGFYEANCRDDWVEVISRGMCTILHVAIHDLSVQVYLTGLILFDECLLQFERMRIISQRKVKKLFSHLILYLVGKLADGNSKVAEAAHTALVSAAFCELVGPLHISAQVMKRICPSKKTKDKSVVRRVQILKALFEEFGRSKLIDNIETTMNFLATCGFSHQHVEAREASKSLASFIKIDIANVESGEGEGEDVIRQEKDIEMALKPADEKNHSALVTVSSKTPGKKKGRGRGRSRKNIFG